MIFVYLFINYTIHPMRFLPLRFFHSEAPNAPCIDLSSSESESGGEPRRSDARFGSEKGCGCLLLGDWVVRETLHFMLLFMFLLHRMCQIMYRCCKSLSVLVFCLQHLPATAWPSLLTEAALQPRPGWRLNNIQKALAVWAPGHNLKFLDPARAFCGCLCCHLPYRYESHGI